MGRIANFIEPVIDLATPTFHSDPEFHANYNPVKFSSLGRFGTSKLELPFTLLLMDDVLQTGSKFTLCFYRPQMGGAPLHDAVGLLTDQFGELGGRIDGDEPWQNAGWSATGLPAGCKSQTARWRSVIC